MITRDVHVVDTNTDCRSTRMGACQNTQYFLMRDGGNRALGPRKCDSSDDLELYPEAPLDAVRSSCAHHVATRIPSAIAANLAAACPALSNAIRHHLEPHGSSASEARDAARSRSPWTSALARTDPHATEAANRRQRCRQVLTFSGFFRPDVCVTPSSSGSPNR